MKRLLLLISTPCYLLITTSFILPHPLKMSYSIITVSKKEKMITIENRFFADDFQKCVNKEYHQMYDFMRFHRNKEPRSVIDKFINTYFKIKVNGKELTFTCTGSEYVEDANLFYFRYTFTNVALAKSNSVELKNKLLLNYFDDQKNGVVLNLSANIVAKTIEFDSKYTSETINF